MSYWGWGPRRIDVWKRERERDKEINYTYEDMNGYSSVTYGGNLEAEISHDKNYHLFPYIYVL